MTADAELAALRTEAAELRGEVRELRARLDALAPADGSRFDAIYPAFQARFRGSEQDVRDRLAVYLPDVEGVATGLPVLDVGPGRGEWLAMLTERGVSAYGVEHSAEMAARLRARGLSVEQGDAVAHLQGLSPASLDAVTAVHVVEHLGLDALLALLAAARAALRPGGLLLLETPDPTNLVMGACNFWMDPTHLRPVPPALLEFLVGASGFERVEVRRLHPKEQVDLGGLPVPGVDPAASGLLARALTTGLFGTQDYAVLAHAPDGSP